MKKVIQFHFFLLLTSIGFSQQEDSLTLVAKQLAYSGNYSKSIDLLKPIETIEAQQLLARVYAWTHSYNESLRIIEKLINAFPEVVDNYQIAATTALWGGQWLDCYQYSNDGLENGGDSLVFGILQLKALIASKKIIEAEVLCHQLLMKYPNDGSLKQLLQLIEQFQFQKEVSISHTRDYLTIDTSEWRSTSFLLKNKTKYGPLILSAHHAKRFQKSGIQGELEFYPKIDSNYYAYLDLGISPTPLFPNFRHGGSLFRTFRRGIELELGYRNMQFKDAGRVWFYLGSIIKYIGNNSITYRLTSIKSPLGSSATHGLKLIHYLDDALSYVAVELGSGTNARDYQAYGSFQTFTNLNSKRIQLDYRQALNHQYSIQLTGAFEDAFYRENKRAKRWTWGVTLSSKF